MKSTETPGKNTLRPDASQKLTKVTRPHIEGALERERLFDFFDNCNVPLVWICAPGGAGKTTLVSNYIESRHIPCLWYQIDGGDADLATFFHYLGLAGMQADPQSEKQFPAFTPEYQLGISEFSRNFFGELADCLATPSLLVFEDCQQVDNNAPLYPALLEGLSRLPRGVMTVFISRFDPPPVLARLKVNRRLKTLGMAEIRLSEEEFFALADTRGIDIDRRDLLLIYKQMEGWAAGLNLVQDHLQSFGKSPDNFEQITPEGTFDYFSSEAFIKLNTKTQQFLIKSAFLPEMSAPMSEQLTGEPEAASILDSLYRQNHFTNKREQETPYYQYHPLFRHFLMQKAHSMLHQEEIVRLQRTAANLLIRAEQHEPAVELLFINHEWEALIGIILDQAPTLLQQGRIQTLASWTGLLPKEMVESVPWLSYWLGVARLPINPSEAQDHFTRAFEQFTLQLDDGPGRALAWAGLLESVVYGFEDFHPLDRWLARIDEIVGSPQDLPEGPVGAKIAAAIFLALAHRQPSHSRFKEWQDRALELVDTTEDPYCKIQVLTQSIVLDGCRGSREDIEEVFSKVLRLLNAPESPPFVRISALFAEFYASCWIGSDPQKAADIAHRALSISNDSGVHLMDAMLLGCGITGEMMAGNLKGAAELLDQMQCLCESAGTFYRSFYLHIRGFLALFQGELPRAAMHAGRALELTGQCGFVHGHAMSLLLIAAIYLAKGETEACQKYLDSAESICHSAGWNFFLIVVDLCRAQSQLQDGNMKNGLDLLKSAFGLARKHSILIQYLSVRPWMASLCAIALANNIETDFVRSLVRRMNLTTDKPPVEVEQWPWPIRIYTLGKFEIHCNETPLQSEGKVQQRPLALLKAIIAMGGTGVSEARLLDALWPDADGDAARQSLKVALHRLRKLLANQAAIRYAEGTLSLDPSCCWTDVWALERLLARSTHSAEDLDIAALERIFDLYRGAFLKEDEHESWTIPTRERLRSRFLHSAEIIGDHLERADRWEDAIERYLRALEVDPHIERFYQRLMLCYHHMGRPAASLSTYERCRKVLDKTLGIKPSRQTESIRQRILAEG